MIIDHCLSKTFASSSWLSAYHRHHRLLYYAPSFISISTCNIEPPGEVGQGKSLVDGTDMGHSISRVDDNTWKNNGSWPDPYPTPNPKTLIMQSSTRSWGKKLTCEKSLSVQCEYSLDRDVDCVKPIVLKHHLRRKFSWASSTQKQRELLYTGKIFHTVF